MTTQAELRRLIPQFRQRGFGLWRRRVYDVPRAWEQDCWEHHRPFLYIQSDSAMATLLVDLTPAGSLGWDAQMSDATFAWWEAACQQVLERRRPDARNGVGRTWSHLVELEQRGALALAEGLVVRLREPTGWQPLTDQPGPGEDQFAGWQRLDFRWTADLANPRADAPPPNCAAEEDE